MGNSRYIDRIVIHCSATTPDTDIGADEIRMWHQDRGWQDIGYHYVIRRDGTLEVGRPEHVVGAHARGYNEHSIGVCLVGGVTESAVSDANFTLKQYLKLLTLCTHLMRKYKDAQVVGHRDLPGVAKDCPCFDVAEFFK